MGREPSKKKALPSSRSLSARIASPGPSSASASASNNAGAVASTPSSRQLSPTGSISETSSRRALTKSQRRKVAKTRKREAAAAAQAGASKEREAGGLVVKGRSKAKGSMDHDGLRDDDGEEEEEEGEIDEFAGLFAVDLTPSVVHIDEAGGGDEGDGDARASLEDSKGKGKVLQRQLEDDEQAREREASRELRRLEDEQMRAFAAEVADSDDDDDMSSSGSDEEEDADTIGKAEMLFDDEEGMARAIRGKIKDDSAAKVTGRYYKEVDLTRSCALCGEQGHTSRECPHSQCFTCGEVNGDHEARHCPVALVCSGCGSRGHVSRNCDLPPNLRMSFGSRCSRCSSQQHSAPNCPDIWRVYNRSGAKIKSIKVLYACANCGRNSDHFIDDCPAPRGHPLKYVDESAFNSFAARGAKASDDGRRNTMPPGSRGAAGAASAAKRRGDYQRAAVVEEVDDDDDWFAARRGGGPSGGRNGGRDFGGGGGRRGAGGSTERSHWGGRYAAAKRRREDYEDSPRGGRSSHIHFDTDSPGHSDSGGRKGSSRGHGDPFASRIDDYDLPRHRGGGGSGGSQGRARGGGGPPPLSTRLGPSYRGGYT